MNKLVCFALLATCVALCCAFPSEERSDALELMREFRAKRDHCGGVAQAALKSFGVTDADHLNCGHNAKRWESEFASHLAKREKEHSRNYARGLACCSPQCDWLLDYLEVDATVVKCLDNKCNLAATAEHV